MNVYVPFSSVVVLSDLVPIVHDNSAFEIVLFIPSTNFPVIVTTSPTLAGFGVALTVILATWLTTVNTVSLELPA